MKKQTVIPPSEQKAQNQKRNTQIEIFVQENEPKPGRSRYRWAWKESAEKNVFGGASSLEEIKTRAARMFPDKEIVLLLL